MADARNKRADAERSRALLKTGAVSEQSHERTEALAEVAEKTAAALRAQKDYEIIRAPFSGTVTARFADPGALLQGATTAQTGALPVVTISDSDRLRVYVYPDQKIASMIRVGDPAEVVDPTKPDAKISGKVARTSGELDPKTCTLLA